MFPLAPARATVVAGTCDAFGLASGVAGGFDLEGALGHELDFSFAGPPSTGGAAAGIKRDECLCGAEE